jgi:nitrogen fixation NifU-like protein
VTRTSDLYQSAIVEHDSSPRNYGSLEAPSHRANGRNPLCGDELTVELAVVDGRIDAIGFEGKGCAISRASASMMTTALKGKTVAEAEVLFERFHAMLTEGGDSADLGKLVALQGVAAYPMRVKCATLAWHAMKSAIAGGVSEPTVVSHES